jgi:hypothetical protein
VVGDVPQVLLQLLVRAVLLEAGDERLEHRVEGPRRALELDHLAGQLVDAARDRGVAAEDLDLDLLDVLLEPGHDRRVAVDHAVEDGVEHRLGAAGEELRVVLHAMPYGAEVRASGCGEP